MLSLQIYSLKSKVCKIGKMGKEALSSSVDWKADWESNLWQLTAEYNLFSLHQTMQPGDKFNSDHPWCTLIFAWPSSSTACQSDTWPLLVQRKKRGSWPVITANAEIGYMKKTCGRNHCNLEKKRLTRDSQYHCAGSQYRMMFCWCFDISPSPGSTLESSGHEPHWQARSSCYSCQVLDFPALKMRRKYGFTVNRFNVSTMDITVLWIQSGCAQQRAFFKSFEPVSKDGVLEAVERTKVPPASVGKGSPWAREISRKEWQRAHFCIFSQAHGIRHQLKETFCGFTMKYGNSRAHIRTLEMVSVAPEPVQEHSAHPESKEAVDLVGPKHSTRIPSGIYRNTSDTADRCCGKFWCFGLSWYISHQFLPNVVSEVEKWKSKKLHAISLLQVTSSTRSSYQSCINSHQKKSKTSKVLFHAVPCCSNPLFNVVSFSLVSPLLPGIFLIILWFWRFRLIFLPWPISGSSSLLMYFKVTSSHVVILH